MISNRSFKAIISTRCLRPLSTKSAPEIKESFIFPNEREGNLFFDNWSLTVDGVSPIGDAFRNARTGLLATRIGLPKSSTSFKISSPAIFGQYKLLEAGASLSHDDFKDLKEAQRLHLMSGIDLYVEDAGLGALSDIRVGVRIVSDNPAFALIGRNLLIPKPPRPVDHRSRYNGWNLDPRWRAPVKIWDGSRYVVTENNAAPLKGERPIVAFTGSLGDKVCIQFVESNSKVVGKIRV